MANKAYDTPPDRTPWRRVEELSADPAKGSEPQKRRVIDEREKAAYEEALAAHKGREATFRDYTLSPAFMQDVKAHQDEHGVPRAQAIRAVVDAKHPGSPPKKPTPAKPVLDTKGFRDEVQKLVKSGLSRAEAIRRVGNNVRVSGQKGS